MTDRKRVAILGSTGSIGRQTLDVVRWMSDRFEIVGLAAGSYSEAFRAQVDEFRPRSIAVGQGAGEEWAALPDGVLRGPEGLCAVATAEDVDLVVMATVGRAGLAPTVEALQAG